MNGTYRGIFSQRLYIRHGEVRLVYPCWHCISNPCMVKNVGAERGFLRVALTLVGRQSIFCSIFLQNKCENEKKMVLEGTSGSTSPVPLIPPNITVMRLTPD